MYLNTNSKTADEMATKKQKAQIHIIKDQLGLSRDEYEALLGSYGVASSADPDFGVSDAEDLIGTLRRELNARQGAKQYHGWGKNKYEYLRPRPANMGDPKQLRKIEAMWRDIARNPGDSALEKFIQRQTGKRNIVWLEKDDTRAVLTALKTMKEEQQSQPAKHTDA